MQILILHIICIMQITVLHTVCIMQNLVLHCICMILHFRGGWTGSFLSINSVFCPSGHRGFAAFFFQLIGSFPGSSLPWVMFLPLMKYKDTLNLINPCTKALFKKSAFFPAPVSYKFNVFSIKSTQLPCWPVLSAPAPQDLQGAHTPQTQRFFQTMHFGMLPETDSKANVKIHKKPHLPVVAFLSEL